MNKNIVLKVLALVVIVGLMTFGYIYNESKVEKVSQKAQQALQLPELKNSPEAERLISELPIPPKNKYSVITQDQLKSLIDAKANLRIVDVREMDKVYEEKSTGFIPRTILMPNETGIPMVWAGKVEDEKMPLIFITEDGKKDAYIASMFANSGYSKVYLLEGGISSWEGSTTKNIKETISTSMLKNPNHTKFLYTIGELDQIQSKK